MADGAIDPSGCWLATANASSVTFWSLLGDYPLVLRGPRWEVSDVAFTPDGKRLITASGDTLRVWNVDDGRPNRVLLRDEDLVFPMIDIDPSGKNILVSANRGKVFLVPLEGGSPRRLEGFSADSSVGPVVLSADGRFAAAAPWQSPKENKVIRVWDLESGDPRILGPVEGAGDGEEGIYSSLHFLPDGRLLSSGVDGLRIWDLKDGNAKLLESGILSASALSSDGQHLLYVDCADARPKSPCRLKWADTVSGKSRTLDSHGATLHTAAFDPTGTLVVSGAFDGMVRVGPVSGGNPHLLFGHKGTVLAVAVSPDGRWIASAGVDESIRLWPMPDMNEPPFQTLPYEELLERLRSVTNVRVVADEDSSTGYSIDYAPFPGWETVPRW
jgi:WD40 repeat protein